jgi:hypothetical protein
MLCFFKSPPERSLPLTYGLGFASQSTEAFSFEIAKMDIRLTRPLVGFRSVRSTPKTRHRLCVAKRTLVEYQRRAFMFGNTNSAVRTICRGPIRNIPFEVANAVATANAPIQFFPRELRQSPLCRPDCESRLRRLPAFRIADPREMAALGPQPAPAPRMSPRTANLW